MNGDLANTKPGNIYVQPTIKEQLLNKKKSLEDELAKVDSALMLMKNNPTISAVVESIRKALGIV